MFADPTTDKSNETHMMISYDDSLRVGGPSYIICEPSVFFWIAARFRVLPRGARKGSSRKKAVSEDEAEFQGGGADAGSGPG